MDIQGYIETVLGYVWRILFELDFVPGTSFKHTYLWFLISPIVLGVCVHILQNK